MSRIDDALKVAEGGKPVSEPDVIRSDHGSSLGQYRQEGGSRAHARDATPALRPVEPRRTETSEASATATAPDVTVAPDRSDRLDRSNRSDRLDRSDRSEPTPARPTNKRRSAPVADADMQARLVTGETSAVSLEQYRRLAAVLHDEQADAQLKTVMVTSAVPDEGKTLTATNLALTLSESYGRRVLVVDADLRCPTMHTTLGLSNDRGLSDALRSSNGDLPLTQVSDNLSVLTAGRPGSNPLASLTSARMEEILRDCAARFDWVILDTAPVGVLPDAQVLARFVGGVILVIGAGSTPAAAVERAVAELGGPDAIIGTVLNRVDERRIPDAGYYGRYYGSGDGG
jgi:capsular exopolysaccharide synthesis family protein